jgi:site-specific recombinase XerD
MNIRGDEMMQENGLNMLIEQTLLSLRQDGMTAGAISYCKITGYDAIRNYHEECGQTDYSYEICQNLILELRVRCEAGEMPRHRWRTVRRCVEVLHRFKESGLTKLPKLPKWELITGPLRRTPTVEQFTNSDDLFVLVWKIKRALAQTGLPQRNIMKYTYVGFDKILRHCMLENSAVYDKKAIDYFVSEAYVKYQNGAMCLSVFNAARKAAAFIHEYRATGLIQRSILNHWGIKYPCDYFSGILNVFCCSMDNSGQWSKRSLSSARHSLGQFLITLEKMGYDNFQCVTLKVVSDCIFTIAKRYTSGLKPTLSYIRAFLRFLAEQGISNIALVTAVPGSVSPKRVVYDGFDAQETDKLLAAVDRSTPQGKRDYAMLLIGVRTGLRAIDVVNLKRQDINWRGHTINIIQSKTKRPLGIHLSAEVGNAIADYVLNGRPDCDSPNVFVRAVYPIQPLSSAAAGGLVRLYSRRAGLPVLLSRPVGFHALRRSFGASLLLGGVSVDMIQELLGQRDLNSVQPYLAANEAGLKNCALRLIPLTGAEEADGYDVSV